MGFGFAGGPWRARVAIPGEAVMLCGGDSQHLRTFQELGTLSAVSACRLQGRDLNNGLAGDGAPHGRNSFYGERYSAF